MPLTRHKRKVVKRRSRAPRIAAVASSYAVRLVQQLRPALGLVLDRVLPMTAPTGVRTDTHVKRPGSRGGHIIGYRNGEPIYGPASTPHEFKSSLKVIVSEFRKKHPGLSSKDLHLKMVESQRAGDNVLSGVFSPIRPSTAKLIKEIAEEIKPVSGNRRETEIETVKGNPIRVNVLRNPSVEQLNELPDDVRGWLLPTGDLHLIDNATVLHGGISQAMRNVGFLDEKEYVKLNKPIDEVDLKNGIPLQRVEGSNLFGFTLEAAFILFDEGEMSAEELKAVKDTMKKGRRKSPHILFNPTIRIDIRTDAASFKTLAATFGGLRVAFMQRMLAGAELDAWRAARAVDTQNKSEFDRVLGLDLTLSEPWLRPMLEDWVAQNVSLVRGMSERSLTDMEQIILRMVRDGESIAGIRKELVERFEISMNRARFIARDQVSKINGLLTEQRQTRLGVTEYIWHTVEDIRVRGALNPGTAKANHARLNGTVQNWDEPPLTNRNKGERNHPGMDYNCRCFAEPVLDELLA